MVLKPGRILIHREDGSTLDIAAHSIRITPLEEPMATATTDPDAPQPRPTKAAMAALQQELVEQRRLTSAALHQAEEAAEDRNRWRDAKIQDSEAEAISGCVRALDELTGRNRNRSGNDFAAMSPSYGPSYPQDPTTTPVGRVLIHLAQRYGVALIPTPPPEVDLEEPVTMTVPRRIAESIRY